MLERFAQTLHFAFRQQDAIARVGRILTTGGFSLKKLLAAAIAFVEMFGCVISDYPVTPVGEGPVLDGYEQVFLMISTATRWISRSGSCGIPARIPTGRRRWKTAICS